MPFSRSGRMKRGAFFSEGGMRRGRGGRGSRAARLGVLGALVWVIGGGRGVHAVVPLIDGSDETEGSIKWAVKLCLKENAVGTSCPLSVARTWGQMADWNVSGVTSMDEMFVDRDSSYDSVSTFNGDLSKWDVSSVTSMYKMFIGAHAFNGDLSEWDVSSVTYMGWILLVN